MSTQTSLSGICYEQIKDTFWYGIYGDFKLVIDKSTDCFNATKLCEATGKRFRNWMILAKSKELIEYYNVLKSPPTSPSRDDAKKTPLTSEGRLFEKDAAGIPAASFYEIKEAQYHESKLITGTYLCKELILSLATWISNDFYHKCFNIVNHYFVKDFKEREGDLQKYIQEVEANANKLKAENEAKDKLLQEKQDKIDEVLLQLKRMDDKNTVLIQQNKAMMNKLVDISDQNDELLEKNADLDDKVGKVHLKLGIAAYDRAPLPKSARKQECFLLLKLNDPEEYWDYYTIRAQQTRANASLRFKQQMYPNMTVLINMPCHPNSKSLYVRIKDDLNNQGIEVNGNNLRIIDENAITEEELVTMMKRVYRSRLDIANEPIDA